MTQVREKPNSQAEQMVNFLGLPFLRIATWQSESPETTAALAGQFANELKPGKVIALSGDLGAGKTVFVQGVAEAFGYSGLAHSPTYALVHEYDARYPLFHLDLYRLEKNADWQEIGLNDYLGGDGIALVEWPERLPEKTRIDYWVRIQLGNFPDNTDVISTVNQQNEGPIKEPCRLIEIFKAVLF